MLIQCQACNAKYRLNLESIPEHKAFIKCKKCSAPIYIDPREESSLSPVPEQEALEAELPASVLITCVHCQARYRVPVDKLGRSGLKLRCSHCQTVFSAPPPSEEKQAAPVAEVRRREDRLDVYPPARVGQETPQDGARAAQGFEPTSEQAGEQARMPLPDDAHVADMFDDLQVQLQPPSRESVAEQAYLDAVSLTEEDDLYTIPPQGRFSDGQKSRFFLTPEATPQAAASSAPSEPEFTAVPGSGMAQHLNPMVPTQSRDNLRLGILYAAAGLLLLAATGWGGLLYFSPFSSDPYVSQTQPPPELRLSTTRKGYFITNKPGGVRLYVLSGELINGFPDSDEVSWVRLRGTVSEQGGQRQGFSYVGNQLDDYQLATWSPAAIRAYYGYLNGRKDNNYHIPQGQRVPYQIVIIGLKQPVGRVRMELISYQRKGLPIRLQMPTAP